MVVGRLDRRDLAVLQVDDLAGVPDQRRDVGGDEHLAVAEAEHDGAAVAGDDELRRGSACRGRRGRRCPRRCAGWRSTASSSVRSSFAASSAATMCARHSVSVSVTNFTPSAVSWARSASAFSMMPLCTSGDAVLRVGVRVGVGVVRLAVGGPARVADADRRLGLLRVELVPQVLDAAGRLGDLQPAAVHDGEARRVVAPVLKPVQPLDKHGGRVPPADVPHDPTHRSSVLPLPACWCAAGSRRPCGGAGAPTARPP